MTEIELKPELLTVGQLLTSADVSYTIPIFQRNFSWQAEQIEQLIMDVSGAPTAGKTYFLGNLMVTERVTTESGKQDFEVIDGQQRLTTLYLLLTVLAANKKQTTQSLVGRLRYASRPRAQAALEAAPRQLEEDVDIIKARLMRDLTSDAERGCFAWIWEACADMDSYVQISLTPRRPQLRNQIFGEDLSGLQAEDFDDLLGHQAQPVSADSDGSTSKAKEEPLRAGHADVDLLRRDGFTLDKALEAYERQEDFTEQEDANNERFKSTIPFPTFLLHALRVFTGDQTESERQLDDRDLVGTFVAAFAPTDLETSPAGSGPSDRASDFAIHLLRIRNLFDAFVLKHQYTANSSEDGEWSMPRLVRRTSRGKLTPGYVNTLSSRASESDDDSDSATEGLLLIESMLRVTYTSPRTMHWITKVLRTLDEGNHKRPTGEELLEVLRKHARGKVKQAYFEVGEPTRFGIERIVFTYLDYLLLERDRRGTSPILGGRNDRFRFAFRNSIEHFYPQSPDSQQSGDVVTAEYRDLLGNLALVSVGANSKFGNSLPMAKAENYKGTIEAQSPKLHLMAEITRKAKRWDNEQVIAHHEEMVGLLKADLYGSTA